MVDPSAVAELPALKELSFSATKALVSLLMLKRANVVRVSLPKSPVEELLKRLGSELHP